MPEDKDNAVIWASDTHSVSGRTLVLEDDGRSCWLYLCDCDGGIAKSVLAYSPIAPVLHSEFKKIGPSDTPVLMADYASPDAVITDRYPDDFAFRWREDGGAGAVLYREEVIAVVSAEEKYGSSRAITRSGPFGGPLQLERYDWL